MADRPDPYVRKDPNDIIRSGDWNELQIQTREEILSHTHTGIYDGKHHGSLIPGAAIDPATGVSIRTLTTSGNLTVGGDLKVNGKLLLGDIAGLLATVKGLKGNVGIGTETPRAKLEVIGDLNVTDGFVRRISMATGLGPVDGTRSGPITSRVLTFTKHYADTAIRIIYCDNFRVNGSNVAARWEIRVDDGIPPGGPIYQDKYASGGNYHEPGVIMGYAQGIVPGVHKIQVWTAIAPEYPECDACTGWHSSRWTLEAQEVWI